MSNQLTIQQNNQIEILTDSQLVLSKKISQVGKLNEITFVKKILEFKSIKQFDLSNPNDKTELSQGLSMILVKASNLCGLKGEIDNINKQDITNYFIRYQKNLSLEEIDYAFQLERYNLLPPKSNHYQLFNVEYVSEIISKFKALKSDIRFKHDLPISLPEPKEKDNISDEDKELIVIQGVLSDFENYKQNSKIEDGRPYVYDYLYEIGAFPKHDEPFRKGILERAKAEYLEDLERDKKNSSNLKRVKHINQIINQVTQDKHPLKTKSKQIILRDFYDSVIEKGQKYSDVLSWIKNNKK